MHNPLGILKFAVFTIHLSFFLLFFSFLFFFFFFFKFLIIQCMIPLMATLLTCLICFLTLLEVQHTVVTIVVYSHCIIWLRDCKNVHKLVKCEFKLPVICSYYVIIHTSPSLHSVMYKMSLIVTYQANYQEFCFQVYFLFLYTEF